MLPQAINLPGVGNARELGGYAIGKKHVKRGVLLRSADLSQATPEALRLLHDEYRLQTLVDLRMTVEQRRKPDPQVSGATNRCVNIIEMEDFPVPEDVDPAQLDLLDDPNASRLDLFELAYEFGMVGPQMYVDFLLGERGKAGYADFLREVLDLDDGRAILWHCTDGKDRTGVAAMLVLFALGASRDTVLADYLLTNDYNAATVDAAMRQFAASPMPEDKREVLRVMVGGVAESYLVRAIEALVEHFGGVDGYLRELGVGESEKRELQHRFLA